MESLRASPDAKFAVVRDYGGEVQLWDGHMTKRLLTEIESIKTVTFSRDGSRMAISTKEGGAQVFDCTTFEVVATLEVDKIRRLELLNDGRLAILQIPLDDEHIIIQLWALEAKKKKNKKLLTLTAWVFAIEAEDSAEDSTDDSADDSENDYLIKFSSDGQWIAFCGNLETTQGRKANLVLYEVAARKKKLIPSKYPITAFDFHPKSHIYALANDGDQIIIREANVIGKKFTFKAAKIGKKGPLSYPGFAITSKGQLVTVSKYFGYERNIVQLWDIIAGMEIGRYEIDFTPEKLSLSSDERYLECSKGPVPLPISLSVQDEAIKTSDDNTMRTCFWVSGQWIMQGFERLIWLSPEYWTETFTVRNDTVVVVQQTGSIAVFKFDSN